MFRMIIALAMVCVFFMSNVAYATKFGETAPIEVLRANTYDVEERFWIAQDETIESAYDKIASVMQTLNRHQAYEILVFIYPEKKWYKLLDKLEASGKFKLDPVIHTSDGEEYYFIRVQNK